MQRETLIAIGGGLLSAVAAVFYLSGSGLAILFAYFAAVPLLMVGLGLGSRFVIIAIAAGICATAITGGFLHAGIFTLVQGLPAWLISMMVALPSGASSGSDVTVPSEEQEPQVTPAPATTDPRTPGMALSAISLAGGLFILVAAFSFGESSLKEQVDVYLDTAFRVMAPGIQEDGRLILVNRLNTFFPSALAASWILMAVINAVVAQSVLVKAGKNLWQTPAYSEMDIPLWMSWPLVGSAAIALVAKSAGALDLGYAANNVVMTFAVPYFFLGLAVVHSQARRYQAKRVIVVGMYVCLIISLWTALVITAVGIAEQWVGLRGRSGKNDDGQPPVE